MLLGIYNTSCDDDSDTLKSQINFDPFHGLKSFHYLLCFPYTTILISLIRVEIWQN